MRLRLLSALVVTGALAASLPASAEPADTAEAKAFALIRPSVVYIESTMSRNGFSSTIRCTGVVVNPNGYIATAGHCVDVHSHAQNIARAANTTESDVLADLTGLRMSVSVVGAGEHGAIPVVARVVDAEPLGSGDVAVLKVALTGLPAADVAPGVPPLGTPVLAVGYPAGDGGVTDFGFEPTVHSGEVQSTTVEIGQQRAYEVTASLTKGMSGGPTVDLRGRLVGLISSRTTGGQGGNYLAPADAVVAMLPAGVEPGPSASDIAYREGVEALYSGDTTAAVSRFDAALKENPGYPNALALRSEAQRRNGVAVPPWGLALALITVFVAAGAWLGHRSWRRTQLPPM